MLRDGLKIDLRYTRRSERETVERLRRATMILWQIAERERAKGNFPK